MLPLVLAGAGMAAGAYKGYQDKKRQAAEDKYRRAVIEFSPWTKMGAPDVQQRAGMFEQGLSGGASGLALGQNFLNAGAPNDFSGWFGMQKKPAYVDPKWKGEDNTLAQQAYDQKALDSQYRVTG